MPTVATVHTLSWCTGSKPLVMGSENTASSRMQSSIRDERVPACDGWTVGCACPLQPTRTTHSRPMCSTVARRDCRLGWTHPPEGHILYWLVRRQGPFFWLDTNSLFVIKPCIGISPQWTVCRALSQTERPCHSYVLVLYLQQHLNYCFVRDRCFFFWSCPCHIKIVPVCSRCHRCQDLTGSCQTTV